MLQAGGFVAAGVLASGSATADDRTRTHRGESTDRGWTARRGTPGNTGYSAGTSGPQDPAVVDWEQAGAGGSIAVADGVIYRTIDGAVHAFSTEDGDPIAESDDVGAAGAPAIADGRIYVGGENLLAFESDEFVDGEGEVGTVWQQGFDGDVSEPIVADGRAFVVSEGALHAVDTEGGARLWSRSPDERKLVSQSVAVADGAVFTTDGRSLYALEANDGTDRWATADGGFRDQVIVATDDAVAVQVGGLDEVAVYETETGDLRWIGDGYAPALATDDRIYTLAENAVVGYDRESGDEQWRPGLESAIYGPPVADDEKLYVGIRSPDGDAGIVALDLEDGILEWSIETEAHPHDLAIADDTLYAVADGLLAIRAESAFDDVDANETDGDNVTQPENGNDTFETRDPEDVGDDGGNDTDDGNGNGEPEDVDEVLGDDDDEEIPGFTTGAGIAGGAVVLEWLRRTAVDESVSEREQE